jgi:signal transduction histidine kinase
LRGIQERARALGGDCEIQSQPGAGTRILVHLPLTSPSHG